MRPLFSLAVCWGLFLAGATIGCSQSNESKIIPPPAASFPENARELLRPGAAGAGAPKKPAATKPDETKKPDDSQKDDAKKDDGKKDDTKKDDTKKDENKKDDGKKEKN
jgi:hypothetical protein